MRQRIQQTRLNRGKRIAIFQRRLRKVIGSVSYPAAGLPRKLSAGQNIRISLVQEKRDYTGFNPVKHGALPA